MTSLKSAIAAGIRRSIVLTCAYYLLDDWRARRRLAGGDLSTRSGSRHDRLDVDSSLQYIERIHADYLAYGGVDGIGGFSGVVGEIGPGDNFGLALLLLGGGATEVHALDRYRSERDADAQRTIYAALSEKHGLAGLFSGPPAEETIRHLHYHAGEPAETFFRDHDIRFDAILSRAVLEHLYDPLGALSDMAARLNPGGRLVHRIDFRDHGMFAGRHPLTFLTVPGAVYKHMVRGAGRPNRVLLPDYRAWLAGSGMAGTLSITRLAGVEGAIAPAAWKDIDEELRHRALETVTAIRPRLRSPFAAMTDEDLAVAGTVLEARKS